MVWAHNVDNDNIFTDAVGFIDTGEVYSNVISENVITSSISNPCPGSLCMVETARIYCICCCSAQGTMVWACNVDSDKIITDADAVGFTSAYEACD